MRIRKINRTQFMSFPALLLYSIFFVYPLLKDREGGLWAGTYYGGINYRSPFADQFKGYRKPVEGICCLVETIQNRYSPVGKCPYLVCFVSIDHGDIAVRGREIKRIKTGGP